MQASDLASVTAAILAGGLGSRLRPVVPDGPKVLVPVHGRPYVTYLLDWLVHAGVQDVILLTGFRADQVRQALGPVYRGMRLRYSAEPEPRGTAGALRYALPALSGPTILLLNGDSYCDLDVGALWEFHARRRADLTMGLSPVGDVSRYGKVQTSSDGRVLSFHEKGEAAGAGYINAGVYILDPALIEEVPPNRLVSLEWEMLPAWVDKGKRVFGLRSPGRFIDIGIPESYSRAEAFFRRQAGAVSPAARC